MKRFLIILFLLGAFVFYSYADEKDKDIPWYLNSPGHYSYSTYPPSLLDPNYLDKHNRWQEYFNSSIHRPRRGAVVLYQPLSFGESFLKGFSKGIEKGVDNYYRAREQKRYTEAMMGLLKLKWANEGYYSKPTKYSQPQRYFVPERPPPSYEYMTPEMTPEREIALALENGEIDLDWLRETVIKGYEKNYHNPNFPKESLITESPTMCKFPLNKHRLYHRIVMLESFLKRTNLWNKYKEFTNEVVGYLATRDKRPSDFSFAIDVAQDGINIEWEEITSSLSWLYNNAQCPPEKFDAIIEQMMSRGNLSSWQYRTIRLNRYLNSLGLSPVPENVDVNQVYDGDWTIFWDGEKWARKKQEK